MKSRPNYAAGAAATVWLAVIGVPLYALLSSAFNLSRDRASSMERSGE